MCFVFLTGCGGTYSLVEPQTTSIDDHYTVHPQIIWSSLRKGKVETWTVDGPSLQTLHFVKGLEHGDQLVGGSSNNNHPEFKHDMTVLEIQEFVVDNFSRRGYAQVKEKSLRPQKFGEVEGFWFDMTYVDPNGLDGQATVAGAVVKKQLHLIIYSGIAHYFSKHKDHVDRLIESIEMPVAESSKINALTMESSIRQIR